VTTFPHKSEDPKEVPASRGGVHRVQLPNTENKGFLGYIYLYLSFMIKSIVKGYLAGRKQKPDVIWASSPPIFVGLSGWVVAKLLGAKFALDIRDIWPASAVAAGQISDSGFAYTMGRWMEKFLYRSADVISCVATPMQQYIRQYTSIKVEVIYNGVEVPADSMDSSSVDADVLEETSTTNGSHKILYAGNFGHVQQLDLLIDAVADLRDTGLQQNWEVFFLGGGAKKEKLKELVRSHGLTERIHFLDPVPKEEVFDYLQAADVLFIHLQDSEVLRLTIPSKVFDYMLANRPLLAGIEGEGKDIINAVEGNYIFKPGSKKSLKQALKALDASIAEHGCPDNASAVVKRYSRKRQSEGVNRLFKDVVG